MPRSAQNAGRTAKLQIGAWLLICLLSAAGECRTGAESDAEFSSPESAIAESADAEAANAEASTIDAADIERKVRNGRLLGLAAIVGYGVVSWDYFSRQPHAADEGWFQADTAYGGADKLGHFYLSHVLTELFGDQYQQWGLDQASAGRRSAITSFLLMGAMEIGDSFSRYGYSSEDMAMNLLGSYLGYQRYVNESWQRRLDFRVEHSLDGSNNDPFTDYQRTKYLMAVKLDGFDALQGTALEWFEFQLGYYARGYGDDDRPDQRTAYIGISINLARLFERQGWRRTAAVLHFFQPPHLALTVERDFDRASAP